MASNPVSDEVVGPPVGARSVYVRGADPSLSAKGLRTRSRLIEAARTVFERDGFLEARVADISAEAGVSHGTFYTYFESKTEVFRVVISAVMELVWNSGYTRSESVQLTPRERIERSNRQFVHVYRNHGVMMALQEQVMGYDEGTRALRMEVRHRSVERVQHSIERMQAEGVVRSDVDAHLAAAALVSMVSNFCYFWLVMGEHEYDDETAIAMLTELWCSALHLGQAPPA